MRNLRPIIAILTGTLLVLLVTNDFIPLLMDYLFDLKDFKLPIEWSKSGWKTKYWLMDRPPAFDLYQIFFMATGLLMIFSALFQFIPKAIAFGIIGGMVASAAVVLLFPELAYLVKQTPKPFMIAQLSAGLILIPAALNKQNRQLVAKITLWLATILCAVLLIVTLSRSITTLWFVILPVLGVIYLNLSHKKITS